jgi:hypothetical protein
MYNFLPDSHRSLGSLDMFALSDRPRATAPRRGGTSVTRTRAALARARRVRRAPRTPVTPAIPSSPVISPI